MHHLDEVPDQETRTKPDTTRRLRLRIGGVAATAAALAWALLSGYLRTQAEKSGTPWDLQQSLIAVSVSLIVLSIAVGLFHAAKENDRNEKDDR